MGGGSSKEDETPPGPTPEELQRQKRQEEEEERRKQQEEDERLKKEQKEQKEKQEEAERRKALREEENAKKQKLALDKKNLKRKPIAPRLEIAPTPSDNRSNVFTEKKKREDAELNKLNSDEAGTPSAAEEEEKKKSDAPLPEQENSHQEQEIQQPQLVPSSTSPDDAETKNESSPASMSVESRKKSIAPANTEQEEVHVASKSAESSMKLQEMKNSGEISVVVSANNNFSNQQQHEQSQIAPEGGVASSHNNAIMESSFASSHLPTAPPSPHHNREVGPVNNEKNQDTETKIAHAKKENTTVVADHAEEKTPTKINPFVDNEEKHLIEEKSSKKISVEPHFQNDESNFYKAASPETSSPSQNKTVSVVEQGQQTEFANPGHDDNNNTINTSASPLPSNSSKKKKPSSALIRARQELAQEEDALQRESVQRSQRKQQQQQQQDQSSSSPSSSVNKPPLAKKTVSVNRASAGIGIEASSSLNVPPQDDESHQDSKIDVIDVHQEESGKTPSKQLLLENINHDHTSASSLSNKKRSVLSETEKVGNSNDKKTKQVSTEPSLRLVYVMECERLKSHVNKALALQLPRGYNDVMLMTKMKMVHDNQEEVAEKDDNPISADQHQQIASSTARTSQNTAAVPSTSKTARGPASDSSLSDPQSWKKYYYHSNSSKVIAAAALNNKNGVEDISATIQLLFDPTATKIGSSWLQSPLFQQTEKSSSPSAKAHDEAKDNFNEDNDSLETVDLTRNFLGEKGFLPLRPVLNRAANSLRTLIFSHCGLTDKSISDLADLVHEMPSLELLDLRFNPQLSSTLSGKQLKKLAIVKSPKLKILVDGCDLLNPALRRQIENPETEKGHYLSNAAFEPVPRTTDKSKKPPPLDRLLDETYAQLCQENANSRKEFVEDPEEKQRNEGLEKRFHDDALEIKKRLDDEEFARNLTPDQIVERTSLQIEAALAHETLVNMEAAESKAVFRAELDAKKVFSCRIRLLELQRREENVRQQLETVEDARFEEIFFLACDSLQQAIFKHQGRQISMREKDEIDKAEREFFQKRNEKYSGDEAGKEIVLDSSTTLDDLEDREDFRRRRLVDLEDDRFDWVFNVAMDSMQNAFFAQERRKLMRFEESVQSAQEKRALFAEDVQRRETLQREKLTDDEDEKFDWIFNIAMDSLQEAQFHASSRRELLESEQRAMRGEAEKDDDEEEKDENNNNNNQRQQVEKSESDERSKVEELQHDRAVCLLKDAIVEKVVLHSLQHQRKIQEKESLNKNNNSEGPASSTPSSDKQRAEDEEDENREKIQELEHDRAVSMLKQKIIEKSILSVVQHQSKIQEKESLSRNRDVIPPSSTPSAEQKRVESEEDENREKIHELERDRFTTMLKEKTLESVTQNVMSDRNKFAQAQNKSERQQQQLIHREEAEKQENDERGKMEELERDGFSTGLLQPAVNRKIVLDVLARRQKFERVEPSPSSETASNTKKSEDDEIDTPTTKSKSAIVAIDKEKSVELERQESAEREKITFISDDNYFHRIVRPALVQKIVDDVLQHRQKILSRDVTPIVKSPKENNDSEIEEVDTPTNSRNKTNNPKSVSLNNNEHVQQKSELQGEEKTERSKIEDVERDRFMFAAVCPKILEAVKRNALGNARKFDSAEEKHSEKQSQQSKQNVGDEKESGDHFIGAESDQSEQREKIVSVETSSFSSIIVVPFTTQKSLMTVLAHNEKISSKELSWPSCDEKSKRKEQNGDDEEELETPPNGKSRDVENQEAINNVVHEEQENREKILIVEQDGFASSVVKPFTNKKIILNVLSHQKKYFEKENLIKANDDEKIDTPPNEPTRLEKSFINQHRELDTPPRGKTHNEHDQEENTLVASLRKEKRIQQASSDLFVEFSLSRESVVRDESSSSSTIFSLHAQQLRHVEKLPSARKDLERGEKFVREHVLKDQEQEFDALKKKMDKRREKASSSNSSPLANRSFNNSTNNNNNNSSMNAVVVDKRQAREVEGQESDGRVVIFDEEFTKREEIYTKSSREKPKQQLIPHKPPTPATPSNGSKASSLPSSRNSQRKPPLAPPPPLSSSMLRIGSSNVESSSNNNKKKIVPTEIGGPISTSSATPANNNNNNNQNSRSQSRPDSRQIPVQSQQQDNAELSIMSNNNNANSIENIRASLQNNFVKGNESSNPFVGQQQQQASSSPSPRRQLAPMVGENNNNNASVLQFNSSMNNAGTSSRNNVILPSLNDASQKTPSKPTNSSSDPTSSSTPKGSSFRRQQHQQQQPQISNNKNDNDESSKLESPSPPARKDLVQQQENNIRHKPLESLELVASQRGGNNVINDNNNSQQDVQNYPALAMLKKVDDEERRQQQQATATAQNGNGNDDDKLEEEEL